MYRQLSGLLQDASAVKSWWEELIKRGPPSPSSRCTTIVALCRSKALPDALTALTDFSNILSATESFHRLPGKKTRPPRSEIEPDMRDELSSLQVERSSEGQQPDFGLRGTVRPYSLEIVLAKLFRD